MLRVIMMWEVIEGMLVVASAMTSTAAETPLPHREIPTDTTLARLIDESLAARVELARAHALVRAELERVSAAGAPPDPMLELGLLNEGFTGLEIGHDPMSYFSIMASQTLPWPGKLRIARNIATLSAEQVAQAAERTRLSTIAEVRRSYIDLVLLRDRTSLLDHLEVLWMKSLSIARARYEAGDGAQSDLLRAQLELSRLDQRRLALGATVALVLQGLNRLRDRPLDEPIDTPAHLRDLPDVRKDSAFFSLAHALEESPELKAARLAVERAGQARDLAERDYFPDLAIGVGIMVRGALPPMWQATLGGSIPIFAADKQGPLVSAREAETVASSRAVDELERLLRLRTAERRTAFVALIGTLDLYDQGLLIQSEATTESTLAQYKVGRASFSSVLEANAGFIADQEGYLEALAAAHRLLIAEAEISLAAPPPLGAAFATGGSGMAGPGTGSSMGVPRSSSSLGPPSMGPGSTAVPSAASGRDPMGGM